MPIKGLDKLSRTLKDAERAIGNLDGHLGQVSFDPNDPSSIDLAIAEMEATIDARVAGLGGGKIVETLVRGAKELFRQGILDKAAAARAGKGVADDD